MLDNSKLQNVKYTSSLSLISVYNKGRRHEFLINYSVNVTKLVNHLIPAKLTSLLIRVSCGDYLTQTVITSFPFLEVLDLREVQMENWHGVITEKSLKSLRLLFCDIPSSVFSDVLSRNNLKSIWIGNCSHINDSSFENVDGLASITELVCCGDKFQGRCCVEMVNLKFLELKEVDITDTIMKELCGKLVELRALKLRRLERLSHKGFCEIGLLRKLEYLCLQCEVSCKVFDYVKSCPSLESIEFDAEMLTSIYNGNHGVSHLNEIPTLSEVTFHSEKNSISSGQVLRGLCKSKTKCWTVVIEEGDDDHDVYILSREC